MKKEQPSAAWRTGWDTAEEGRAASTNPYRGKEDKEDFDKGFYAWLMWNQENVRRWNCDGETATRE